MNNGFHKFIFTTTLCSIFRKRNINNKNISIKSKLILGSAFITPYIFLYELTNLNEKYNNYSKIEKTIEKSLLDIVLE